MPTMFMMTNNGTITASQIRNALRSDVITLRPKQECYLQSPVQLLEPQTVSGLKQSVLNRPVLLSIER